ncbi:MAG: ABC transporter substrate-binding protein [Rhodoferax sp.]
MSLKKLLHHAVLAACLGIPVAAMAGKADDTLYITMRDAIPNIDPYYNTQSAAVVVNIHVWDTLVDRDPVSYEIKPALALEWKRIDDRTLEFKLRPGVKFHNGDAFSADDVVYTFNTILTDKKVAVPSNINWMEGAEKVDALTVRVRSKKPYPAAIEYIVGTMPIWPKAYRERVGEVEYAKKPVGTGPYRITALESSGEIRMERFADHYAGSPKGRPAIKNLVIRAVPDQTTQIAELITGKSEWIQEVDPNQFDNLSRMPTVQTVRAEVRRLVYLNIAGGGRDNPASPLKNVKVRQAIIHAIDRKTMASQFMPGGSRVPDVVCFDGQFGCNPANNVQRYDYDPRKAKALLAEAGYPNGFDIDFYTYLTPAWGGAVQNYLRAVGINAKMQQLQAAAVIQAAQQGKTPLAIATWGGFGINEVSSYLQYFFTGSAFDQALDKDIHALVDAGGATNDTRARAKAYDDAFRLIAERAHFIPLFTYVKTYAMAKDLNFKPHADDRARFYLASWK